MPKYSLFGFIGLFTVSAPVSHIHVFGSFLCLLCVCICQLVADISMVAQEKKDTPMCESAHLVGGVLLKFSLSKYRFVYSEKASTGSRSSSWRGTGWVSRSTSFCAVPSSSVCTRRLSFSPLTFIKVHVLLHQSQFQWDIVNG